MAIIALVVRRRSPASGAGTNVPPLTARPSPATKSRSSSWLMPLRIGTRAKRPAASAVPIDSVRTLPSTTPGIAASGKLLTSVVDRQRGAGTSAVWSGQPTLAANVSPKASASASGMLVQRERAALHDRPLEEPARAARDEVGEHRQAAGRLAGDRDVVRVAAELRDVALHPAQRRLLVHQAVVAGRAAGPRGERRVREEAERAEPVVDRDDDDAVRRELGAVVVAARRPG